MDRLACWRILCSRTKSIAACLTLSWYLLFICCALCGHTRWGGSSCLYRMHIHNQTSLTILIEFICFPPCRHMEGMKANISPNIDGPSTFPIQKNGRLNKDRLPRFVRSSILNLFENNSIIVRRWKRPNLKTGISLGRYQDLWDWDSLLGWSQGDAPKSYIILFAFLGNERLAVYGCFLVLPPLFC